MQIDAKAIAQPWINYPMYTAACVFRRFLQEIALTAVSQCLHATPPTQPEGRSVNSAGNIHMAKAARANFQRIVTILDKLQSFWHGVRYIRSVLLQKSDGVDQLKLFEDENPGVIDLPPELAALWAEVAGGSRSDSEYEICVSTDRRSGWPELDRHHGFALLSRSRVGLACDAMLAVFRTELESIRGRSKAERLLLYESKATTFSQNVAESSQSGCRGLGLGYSGSSD